MISLPNNQEQRGVVHNHSSSETESFAGSDLLAELAGEATQKLRAMQTEQYEHQARSQNLHEALGRVFQFFNQLSSHLNKVNPVIPRAYYVDLQTVYNHLHWIDAASDYRKQSLSENAFFDHVSFRVRLAAPEPVTVKRRWYEVENLKRELDAFGLRALHDLDESVRSKPQQEFFEAQLAPDFLMRIQFQGNYNTGQIDLLCNNFDGFGLASYTLNPEIVTQRMLDEIGRFLIGRKESLPTLLSSTRYLSRQAAYR